MPASAAGLQSRPRAPLVILDPNNKGVVYIKLLRFAVISL